MDARWLAGLLSWTLVGAAAAQPGPHHIGIAFDTSGSLDPGRPAVIAAVQTLAWSLVLAAPARAPSDVTLGLIAFTDRAEALSVGGERHFGPDDWPLAAGRMGIGNGAVEDGYLGVAEALRQHPKTLPGHLLLITDEDRDVGKGPGQAELLQTLHERDIVLDALVAVRLVCGDGRRALGLTPQRVGYLQDPSGGYALCGDARPDRGRGASVADYVTLALATGGTVWDVTALSEARGRTPEQDQSVRDAFAQGYTSAVLGRSRWDGGEGELIPRPQVEPTAALAGQAVFFDGRASGVRGHGVPVTDWAWDVGDDGTVEHYGPSAAHVFDAPGLYPVRLTVAGGTGRAASRTVWVSVRAP